MFGSLNKCVSPQGRRLLRLWFCRPIVNLQEGAGGCWRVLAGAGGWVASWEGGWVAEDAPPAALYIEPLQVLNDRLDGIQFFMQHPDALKALRSASCAAPCLFEAVCAAVGL